MRKVREYLVTGVVVLGILVLLSSPLLYIYGSGGSEVVTVNRLDTKRSGDSDVYLVFTDKGVFKNADSWFYFKFSSSDYQNELKEGQRFRISYYGWRMGFFSMYPNIVSYSAVTE